MIGIFCLKNITISKERHVSNLTIERIRQIDGIGWTVCYWQKLCLCFFACILISIFILPLLSSWFHSLSSSKKHLILFSYFGFLFRHIFLNISHHMFIMHLFPLSYSPLISPLPFLWTAILESHSHFWWTFKIYSDGSWVCT